MDANVGEFTGGGGGGTGRFVCVESVGKYSFVEFRES